jgi:predicted kinase
MATAAGSGDMSGAGVIVLAGLPGAGKSTLARALAARLAGARVLDKDAVRDALFGPCDYTATESQVSVAAMLDAARYHLGRGRTVIFDGMTFSRRQYLGAVAGLGEEVDVSVAVIVCDVPLDVAISRVTADAGHLAINRNADSVRRVAAEMEEPDGDYLTLDTTAPLDECVALALAYVETSKR